MLRIYQFDRSLRLLACLVTSGLAQQARGNPIPNIKSSNAMIHSKTEKHSCSQTSAFSHKENRHSQGVGVGGGVGGECIPSRFPQFMGITAPL